MEVSRVLKSNWLTRSPDPQAGFVTVLLSALLFLGGLLNISGVAHADQWLEATPHLVFKQHQYWRLWTTLVAHADIGHLLSNLLLFVPLCFALSAYFGFILFPFIGFLMGGVVNFFVLKTLPTDAALIGVSGVVYWMGATWLTLYLLIDSQDRRRRRVGKVLFVMMALFFPQSFHPEVSYLSHLYGFLLGLLTGFIYYTLMRQKILAAQVYEEIIEENFEAPEEACSVPR
jgi:rhomboid protease GluP